MYKHVNSASRLHALLSKAQVQPDQATFEMWAEVFGAKGASGHETAQLVLSHLHWLHLETDLLEQQVKAQKLSPYLYEGAFGRIRQIISPLNLAASWQGYKGNLTPDVLLSLAFCNELLPDEEALIDSAVLEQIEKEVSELESLVQASSLPDRAKKLVNHHLELIRQALAQYPIFGAKALREVGRTALGEIIEVKDVIVAEQKTEEIRRLGELWKKINSAADNALKAEKLHQLGSRAWDALLTWIQQ